MAAPTHSIGQQTQTGTTGTPAARADELETAGIEGHTTWPVIAHLPTTLAVAIPMRSLRVRDLLTLQPGQIVRTDRAPIEDVPLSAPGQQLAWGEFDVANGNIALRITRLA